MVDGPSVIAGIIIGLVIAFAIKACADFFFMSKLWVGSSV